MQVGTNVWLRNANVDLFHNDKWIASTVKSMRLGPNGETIVVLNKDMKDKTESTLVIPAGQFELEELKYRNTAQQQNTVTNLNDLCFLNEPELLMTLRSRYQRNILSTYYGQVLLHFNPMRVSAEEDTHSEADEVLERFALDVRNHTGMAPGAWDAARKFVQSQTGSLGRSLSNENLRAQMGASAQSKGGLLSLLEDQLADDGDETVRAPVLGHSIIINGECASGKTETARVLLRHLLHHSSAGAVPGHEREHAMSLTEKIVQANVLLEALGSARLCRNYNSSRFGKYLELGFDEHKTLVGCHVRTYLLESVLVCRQSAEESNFHVFYQIVRGSKATDRVKWGLSGDYTAYHYLSQSALKSTPSFSDDSGYASNNTSSNNLGAAMAQAHSQAAQSASEAASTAAAVAAALEMMNSAHSLEQDVAGFQALKDCLQFLNVPAETAQQFFSAIAGILHLGQVKFDTRADLTGDSGVVADLQPLELAARLLGVSQELLETALIKKKSLVIRGEVFAKSLTAAQCAMTRDAIARNLYKRIFDWALQLINDSLHPGNRTSSQMASCLGILDIFGFENLTYNSFEQLCINYAAEVLHKHFCESVFALELVEYQTEGIRYDEALYKRRHPVLKLIGTEVMTIMDETCRLPNPSDQKLLTKMFKKFGVSASPIPGAGSKLVRMEENDYTDRLFRVVHYPTEVTYSVAGFIEKHFDEVPEAAEKMLLTSTSAVLNSNFAMSGGPSPTASAGASSKFSTDNNSPASPGSAASAYRANLNKSSAASTGTAAVKRNQNMNLGNLFRLQLSQLLEEVQQTVPHFVRCIKASEKPLKAASGAQRRESEVHTANAMSNNPLMKKGRRSTAGNNATTIAAATAAVGHAPFNPTKVLEQLRSCGIVDAVAVARSHYRVKQPLRDFYLRYRGIAGVNDALPRSMAPDHDAQAALTGEDTTVICCRRLVEILLTTQFLQDALKSAGLDAAALRWQVGSFAVYLTVSDHSVLETARFAVLETAGAALAYRLRVFGKRLSYLKTLAAIRTIQRVARGRKGRKIARRQRKFIRGVVSLQRRLRNAAYINDALAKLRRLVRALLTIQKVARRFCARRMVKRLKAARDQYLNSSGNLITAKELRLARRRGEISEVSLPIPPVKSKMKDYRVSESALILEIQSMIHGTKVTNHDALVKFDVKETRKVLTEWANAATSAELKAHLMKVAGRVEVAYKLLRPDTLIPIVKVGCLSLFQSSAQRRRHSAKHADKKITKDHNVFKGIVKVQGVIEELLRVAFNERKEALNRIDTIKKDLVRNIRKFGPEFSRSKATPFYAEIQHTKDFIIIADNIMRFGLVLYKYYQNYVSVMVDEFGEKSAYRRGFNDDEVYLLTLQQLMESANGPLHYSEQFLQMANPDPGMDVCAEFPLKLVDARHFADDGTNDGSTRGLIQLHKDVYYRIMPFAPGTDFAVNSFQQFMSPHSIAPSRLLRLSGKSSDNYGQCTYYQASMGFSHYTLVDVFKNPVLVEKINFTSLSAAILTSLLTGAGDCKPENFMVKYVRENSPYGAAGEVEKVEILGVTADQVFQNTAFSYQRIEEAYCHCRPPNAQELLALREQGIKDVGIGFNVLFFLPQMDEPVDPEVCNFFRSTPTIPEEMVCNWLRYLHQQNKRYEALRISGGFTEEDFNALKLPIKIPLGSAIRLLQRLQELREHLSAVDASKLTHHALLSFWYPEMGDYYKDWRYSTNKGHITDEDMALVPTETEEDVSLLPLDHDDPTDRSIHMEMSRNKSLSGKAKRSFFYALTPYNKLYHNAVAELEAEVAAILDARARASNPSAAAEEEAQADEHETEGSASEGPSRGPSRGVSRNTSARLHRIVEGEGEGEGEGGETDRDSEDGMMFARENEEGAAEGQEDGGNTPSSHGGSPRSPQSAKKKNLSKSKRYASNIGGFDNIYGDEASEGEEEYFAYEDAPEGLLPAGATRGLGKANRNDNKNQSFCKHKAATTTSPTGAGPGGFMSPMVGMDVYPETAVTPSAGSRQQSLRFDNLYSADDFDYEEAMQNLSEAEQSVMYLRPTNGAKIPGVPLIPGARSRAPAVMRSNSGREVSPLVARGLNPMSTVKKAPAPMLRTPSKGGEMKDADEASVMTETVLGANPMQPQTPVADEESVAYPETPLAAAAEEEWRVEDENEDGEDEDDDQSGFEEVDETNAVTAATPSSIADVALQFLMSLDFRRFDPAVSRNVCRIIGDSLSFLETLWLRFITEDQLRYMFEGYFEQKRNHRVATALTTTAGPVDEDVDAAASGEIYATKEIKLIGMTADIFKRLQKTTTVNRLRRILGIQVSLVIIEGGDDTFTNVLSGGTSSDASVATAPPTPAVPSVAAVSALVEDETPGKPNLRIVTSESRDVSPQKQASDNLLAGEFPSDSEGEEEAVGDADNTDHAHSPRVKIDFPERYAELKRRTKLVLNSYTNMVGSIPPEMISYNSTIVKEVVRISATTQGALNLPLPMANQFGLIFLEFPGFARIGKELADRGVFNHTNRIVHRLLAHAQIERYVDVIYSILEQTPSVLLLRDRADNFLPCDRVKALPDTKAFKFQLLAAFINAIPNIDVERAAARTAAAAAEQAAHVDSHEIQNFAGYDVFEGSQAGGSRAEGSHAGGSQHGGTDSPPVMSAEEKLTGDEVFLSIYSEDEELIVRALHFKLFTTPAEIKEKKFDLKKVDPATGENIFHKCILCYADEPYIYSSAIETFKIALKVLRERCIAGEMKQVDAERMLFSTMTKVGETAWSLAYTNNCRPMVDAMVSDWTKTGEASGAPAVALAMSPVKRGANKKSAAPAGSRPTSISSVASLTAAPASAPAESSVRHAFEMEEHSESDTEEEKSEDGRPASVTAGAE